MIKTKRRLTACLLLIGLNIAIIWGFSLMPGELSRRFSTWVRDILFSSFPGGDSGGTGHGLVRKLAHATEFACLGILLSWLVRMLLEKKWKIYLLPLLGGLLVAAIDETIQLFVPERAGLLTDVGIDTLGCALGILLITLVQIKKRK